MPSFVCKIIPIRSPEHQYEYIEGVVEDQYARRYQQKNVADSLRLWFAGSLGKDKLRFAGEHVSAFHDTI